MEGMGEIRRLRPGRLVVGAAGRPARGVAHGPPAVHRLLDLQRRAGNRAVVSFLDGGRPLPVQRAVTILSYNVGKGGPDDAALDVPAVRAAIQAAVGGADRQRVLTNLQNADAQGWQGGDVAALATHLCAGLQAATRDRVAEAIGSTLTAQGTNDDEARQFGQASAVAQSMSRAKGTPNQVALQALDTATGAGIAGIATRIRALDAKLMAKQRAVRDFSVEA